MELTAIRLELLKLHLRWSLSRVGGEATTAEALDLKSGFDKASERLTEELAKILTIEDLKSRELQDEMAPLFRVSRSWWPRLSEASIAEHQVYFDPKLHFTSHPTIELSLPMLLFRENPNEERLAASVELLEELSAGHGMPLERISILTLWRGKERNIYIYRQPMGGLWAVGLSGGIEQRPNGETLPQFIQRLVALMLKPRTIFNSSRI